MNEGNYIKISRKILDWEWWHNINTCRLFLYMLLKANWNDGKFEGKVIKRGSFVSSYPKLAAGTDLTVNEIRTAISKLKSTGEITVKSYSKYSVFTIKNYDLYQGDNSQNCSQSSTQNTVYSHPINSQTTTIEEVKKNKKKINDYETSKDVFCAESETDCPSEQSVVIYLPLNDKSQYPVYDENIKGWQEIYPAVDIMQELWKMKGWLDSNSSRQKTRRGINRFINNWLSREQDKYHGNGGNKSGYTGRNDTAYDPREIYGEEWRNGEEFKGF